MNWSHEGIWSSPSPQACDALTPSWLDRRQQADPDLAGLTVINLARFVPVSRSLAFYFVVLSFTPILGSFITESAAMTMSALLLRDHLFSKAGHLHAPEIHYAWHVVRECFHRWHRSRRTRRRRADGRRHLGLGHRVHVQNVRLEGGAGGFGERRISDVVLPYGVAASDHWRGGEARYPHLVDCRAPRIFSPVGGGVRAPPDGIFRSVPVLPRRDLRLSAPPEPVDPA